MTLTREKIRSGWIREMVAAQDLGVRILSEEELNATRESCLACLAAEEDLWLFAYGSLIWNPCIEVAERRIARLHGWHRQFCLWTNLGRGTPEQPGLMLGLERGGSCMGVAYRVTATTIETELDIVWRREMVTGAYSPRWVRLTTAEGDVRAVAFTINRAHERYAGRLPDEQTVATIARAEGPLGPNRDYLYNTVSHLEELGLHDRGLRRLGDAVRGYRAEHALEAPGPVPPADEAAAD
jgi:glutathione-specific gamma-glutamylcyclotransferase